MKLTTRLSLCFLLIAALPIVLVGFLSYQSGRQTIEQELINHLISINLLKKSEMNRFVQNARADLVVKARHLSIRELAAILASPPSESAWVAAYSSIHENHLDLAIRERADFLELFILRAADGLILISTDRKQEGKYRAGDPYFLEGRNRTFVQNIYYSHTREMPAMTISTPITDPRGNLVAVLAGHLNLKELSAIIGQASGLTRTQDTYLVNKSNLFVTEPLFGGGYALQKAVYTRGVEAALAGNDGVGYYDDYRGVPVIGAYRWLPKYELALITEADQSEAFAPLLLLGRKTTAIGGVLVLLAALVGWLIAIMIAKPVHRLVEGTEWVARGNLEYNITETGRDEIGKLTRAFNLMTINLKTTMVSRDELARSEEIFRLAADSASDLIWDWDILSGRVSWHGNIDEILGYGPGEFSCARDAWGKALHPDDSDRVHLALERHLQEGTPYSEEYRIECKDGFFRYWKDSGTAMLDENGQAYRMIGACSDITERKQAEEALRENEENLSVTLHSIGDGVIATDRSGCIVRMNPAAERLTGWTLEEAAGKPVAEVFNIVNTKTGEPAGDTVKRVLQTGKIVGLANHTTLIARNGAKYQIADSAAPICGHAGNLGGVVMVFSDITEAYAMQEALRDSEQRAKRQRSALALLSIEPSVAAGAVAEAVKTLAEAASVAIQTERVSFWLLSEDGSELRCIELFEASTGKHTAGTILKACDYPRYFAAIHQDSRVSTGDARFDPRTSEFREGYLIPLGITSILDAGIFLRGKLTGVTCFEHVGGKREWHADDESFASTISSLLTQVILNAERKQSEEQLKYLSLHDQLTGLYNRTFFEEELNRLSVGREYPVSIISADLDDLKLFNDTMGHEKGDQLLIAAAGVLKMSLRGSDTLARVGGDEFAAILPRADSKTAESIATRIRENASRYNREHADLPLSLSLGMATTQAEEIEIKDLYKQADDLMYRDKLSRSTRACNKTVQALLVILAERAFITEGHAQRLEELCLKVGEKMNLSSSRLSDLALLSQVHDLGKVGIPDQILFKESSLTEEEWITMRQHSEKGFRIALSSTDLAGVADLILKHHERWDGSGYPLGLKGEETPLECRILAVVDAYDAMTNDRPYQKAGNKKTAVEELKRCSGSQFDPEIVDIFISIIELGEKERDQGE